MLPGRRGQTDLRLGRQRIVGGQDLGEDRGEDDDHEQRRRGRAERLTSERGEQRPRAADDDRRLFDADDALRDGRHQRYRMRGSSHAYVRSTTRLSVTSVAATSITLVCTTG